MIQIFKWGKYFKHSMTSKLNFFRRIYDCVCISQNSLSVYHVFSHCSISCNFGHLISSTFFRVFLQCSNDSKRSFFNSIRNGISEFPQIQELQKSFMFHRKSLPLYNRAFWHWNLKIRSKMFGYSEIFRTYNFLLERS